MMVACDRPASSLGRRCRLLSITLPSSYYEPEGECVTTLALTRRIDEIREHASRPLHYKPIILPMDCPTRSAATSISRSPRWA